MRRARSPCAATRRRGSGRRSGGVDLWGGRCDDACDVPDEESNMIDCFSAAVANSLVIVGIACSWSSPDAAYVSSQEVLS